MVAPTTSAKDGVKTPIDTETPANGPVYEIPSDSTDTPKTLEPLPEKYLAEPQGNPLLKVNNPKAGGAYSKEFEAVLKANKTSFESVLINYLIAQSQNDPIMNHYMGVYQGSGYTFAMYDPYDPKIPRGTHEVFMGQGAGMTVSPPEKKIYIDAKKILSDLPLYTQSYPGITPEVVFNAALVNELHSVEGKFTYTPLTFAEADKELKAIAANPKLPLQPGEKTFIDVWVEEVLSHAKTEAYMVMRTGGGNISAQNVMDLPIMNRAKEQYFMAVLVRVYPVEVLQSNRAALQPLLDRVQGSSKSPGLHFSTEQLDQKVKEGLAKPPFGLR